MHSVNEVTGHDWRLCCLAGADTDSLFPGDHEDLPSPIFACVGALW